MDFSFAKNLIFDLGGVLLNIDLPRTGRAFATLAGRDDDWLREQFSFFALAHPFETGQWTEAQFFDFVRQTLNLPQSDHRVTDAQITDAWNALLLDFPPAHLALLQELKSRYRTFLLSNTNPLHMRAVDDILRRDTGHPRLATLFEKMHLSYEMGLWKPDPAIYARVLADHGLLAHETVFFDDNLANVESARQLGIYAVHIQPSLPLLACFPNVPDTPTAAANRPNT